MYLVAVPLPTALCVLGASMALSRVLVEREQGQVERRTDAEAKHVASQLRAAVLKSVEVLPQIGEWWVSEGQPESAAEWRADTGRFLRAEASLREVLWLDPRGRTVSCVLPSGTPGARCAEAPPELTPLAREARDHAGVALSQVIAGPDAPRFYACARIRRGHLVGFVAAAFDAPALIQSLLDQQTPSDYQVKISANGRAVADWKGTAGPFWSQGARRAEVAVGNRWWSVELTPAAMDIDTLQRVVWGFGAVVAILIYCCTALAVVYKRNESALRVEVAERRRAEATIADLNRNLHHQVADFETLLDVLPVGIAISNDPECRDIWMNPQLASMLQAPLGENISRSAPDVAKVPHKLLRDGAEVPPEELPMQLAARTGSSVLGVELDIMRGDGSILNTLSYSAPVFDESGKPRRIINACVDITERKRSERERDVLVEQLQRAEKYRSLGLMAGGIAHDFNNLLTAIVGHAELARRELQPFSPAASAIGEALAAANTAAELVAQLLAYTGRSWFQAKPLDLSAAVRTMAERIQAMAPPQIEVSFDLASDLPPVLAGSRELEQVLRNVVANAVEAIAEGRGVIQVRTSRCVLGAAELARDYPDQKLLPGTYASLEVRDTGAGVSGELAGRVFDPFFTTKFLGRGLGLSAVQGIMRAHGGGVRLAGSSGRGACVEAIFPEAPANWNQGKVA
jgi:signal transduction histidine kinase